MGKLKHGSMIAWDREWIMMPLDIGAPQWHIVQMETGLFLLLKPGAGSTLLFNASFVV